ncbi:hypothetical protein JHK85_007459 [Glycine max]|nr:hypothetical protein JHK85_007459 [Glycine max]
MLKNAEERHCEILGHLLYTAKLDDLQIDMATRRGRDRNQVSTVAASSSDIKEDTSTWHVRWEKQRENDDLDNGLEDIIG